MGCRRKIGSMGLSLIAVLLLGGIATASASAAEFAAEPEFPLNFTFTDNAGLLQTAKGRTVFCTSSTGKGKVAGAGAVAEVEVTFTGCFAEGIKPLECQSNPLVAGVIVTNKIKGRPVTIDTAHTKAGILLEPEVEGGLFAKFNCKLAAAVNETIEVKGSIIAKVRDTDVNVFTKELHLELLAVKGSPVVSQVEETGPRHFLETKGSGTEPFEYEESGIQEAVPGTTTTTALEGKKIKLIP